VSSPQEPQPATTARSCGDCSLCCKVMEIATLGKPPGSWCWNCKPPHGCAIYADRPLECRNFNCLWLVNLRLGEEWKPSRCKMVLVTDLDGGRLVAHVDPRQPDAWRRHPYYAMLKDWARRSMAFRGQIIAAVGRHMYMIFPDRDVDLGIVGLDEFIVVNAIETPTGIRLEPEKVGRDDPRSRGFPPNSRIGHDE
jgi:hypothetical protein